MAKASKRLGELLEYLQMSKAEFSREIGASKSAISQYMSGDRTMRQDRIGLIAEKFNIDPAWLLGYDVPMRREIGNVRLNKSLDMMLSYKEQRVVTAYRSAPHSIQTAVDKLLDIESQSEPLLIAAHENPDGNGDNQHDIDEVMK